MGKKNKLIALIIIAVLACGAGYYGYQTYSFNQRVQASYEMMKEQKVKTNATAKPVAGEVKTNATAKPVAGEVKTNDTAKPVAGEVKTNATAKPVAGEVKTNDTAKPVADETKINDTDKNLVYEILKDSDLEYAYITHNGDTVMLTVKFRKGIQDKDKYLKVSKYMDKVSAQYKDRNVNVTMIPNE